MEGSLMKDEQIQFHIEIRRDEKLLEQLAGDGVDRPHNPLVTLLFTVGEQEFSGDKHGYLDDYALDLCHKLLTAIEKVRNNQRHYFRTVDGVFLVFEPSADDIVVTLCYSRECAEETGQRSSIEPQAKAPFVAVEDGTVELIESFLEIVSEHRPDLRNQPQFTELKEKMTEIID
jgi:hypothetical protein